jgi:hypothetical protein
MGRPTSPGLEAPSALAVVPWADPVVEAHGHRPGSPYVHAVWLGILGPSTTLCWERLARLAANRATATVDTTDLAANRATATVDTTDLAVSLGLSESLGRNAPISRTLGRMVGFGTALRSGDTLAVRLALPDVPARLAGRLSYSARLAHQHWAHLANTPANAPIVDPVSVGL